MRAVSQRSQRSALESVLAAAGAHPLCGRCRGIILELPSRFRRGPCRKRIYGHEKELKLYAGTGGFLHRKRERERERERAREREKDADTETGTETETDKEAERGKEICRDRVGKMEGGVKKY